MSKVQEDKVEHMELRKSERHAALPGPPLTSEELKEEIRIGDESGIAEGDVFARMRKLLHALDHADRNVAA